MKPTDSLRYLLTAVLIVAYQFMGGVAYGEDAIDPPFSDDFETVDSMDNWTILNIDEDEYYWSYGTGTGKVRCLTLKTEGETPNDWLLSPKMNITEGAILGFTYTTSFVLEDAPTRFSVHIIEQSPDNYASAIEIAPITTVEIGSLLDNTFSLSLKDYEGMTDIYFAIKNESVAGASPLIIDDFTVNTENIVTVTTDGNGEISPSGEVRIYNGTSQDFTITANLGYMLSTLTLNGEDIIDQITGNRYGTSTYTLKNCTEDKLLNATFVIPEAKPISYSTIFSTQEEANQWTVIDANGDGVTWVFDENNTFVYNANTPLASADDWLISPRICAGDIDKVYNICLNYTLLWENEYFYYNLIPYIIKGSPANYESAIQLEYERVFVNTIIYYLPVDTELRADISDYVGEDFYIGFKSIVPGYDTEFVAYGFSISSDDPEDIVVVDELTLDYDRINLENNKKTYSSITLNPTAVFIPNGVEVTTPNLYINIDISRNTPEIILNRGTLVSSSWSDIITAKSVDVKINVKRGINHILSFPFAFNIDDILVQNINISYGVNLMLYVYDGEKRASESTEGSTSTGWVEKSSGTIEANQPFAFAVNNNSYYEDYNIVTFSASDVTMEYGDKIVNLSTYKSTVNGGGDANWNFIGNPQYQTANKGFGYSAYLYNNTTDTYSEYSTLEDVTIPPFTGFFVQSDDYFSAITFAANASILMSATTIDNRLTLTINGDEDSAKIFIADGASESYVINEDAIYFETSSNNLAQIFYVDEDGNEIASSVIPNMYNSVSVGYKAISSGTQSIAITTDIYDSTIYLYDSVTGESTLMTDGTIYEFESNSGTYTNRFTLVSEGETTSISKNETSNTTIIAAKNSITICGATTGDTVTIVSSNGITLYSGRVNSAMESINVGVSGVVIVRVGDYVSKVIL